MPLFGIVGAVHGIVSHRCSAFIAATLLCGVSLADEAPVKGSDQFFDQYCGECHYEDQSGGLDLSVLKFEPGNWENLSTWVRVFDRVSAGEMPPKKKGTPRAGGRRDVHPKRFVFAHRLREGTHGPGRPRSPAPAEPLRVRERASRSPERPVGAGEGQAAPRRRSVSFQQERRGARRVLRADGALPERGGLCDAPGHVGGIRTAGEVSAQDLRARRDRAALSCRARMARCPTGSCFPCSTLTRSPRCAPDARPIPARRRASARPWARFPASSAMPVVTAGASTRRSPGATASG